MIINKRIQIVVLAQLIMKPSFEEITDQIEQSVGHLDPPTRIPANQNQELPHDDSDQDVKVPVATVPDRRPYGNMVVFRQNTPHISLGPDYWCFLPAFVAFSLATYFVTVLVFQSSHSFVFRVTTLLICVGQPLAYLLVALSNPGVVLQPANEQSQRVRPCNRCKMTVPRHSRHCNDCGICVANYDHHCPWTSKCIGGNNLVRFYVFLGMTPIYMIYITVAFVVCMSNNLTKIQHLPKNL